jgi:hypothetical protein
VLPAPYQIPAAVLLLGGGLLACFVGQRLLRIVLGLYGFVTGALIAAMVVGQTGGGPPYLAMFIGGVIGALVLILAYFVGVALVGAAIGVGLVYMVMAQFGSAPGSDPHPVAVIFGAVAGAVAAMALQRYVIIVATAFGGAWTALVGGISVFGSRAAQVTDGWVLYPLRIPQGHEWMWVGWIVLGGIGTAVQLSNRPRAAGKR